MWLFGTGKVNWIIYVSPIQLVNTSIYFRILKYVFFTMVLTHCVVLQHALVIYGVLNQHK